MTNHRNGYILEAAGVHKSFVSGDVREHVLRGLDLRVGAGEFLAVMGPSGCGKSTLLHILGLMSGPDEGAVIIDGLNTTGLDERGRADLRRRKIGFVFQRFNLISVLSGYDNIALSMRIRGLDSNPADELLRAMGVADVARKKPSQMSIGQQQRLAVARAIAHRPDILLADEPTGSLDSENAEALLGLLTQANRQDGQTIVMITHSKAVADAAGRIVRMKDGRILDENP
ncbi:MAG: ABC transporter ATP-binding protein [Planctomycetota bacterium]|nr:ABC transporter ATP-binding protein [Planctomycetota bacterium]